MTLQQRSGTLIRVEKLINNMKVTMANLKTEFGTSLAGYLADQVVTSSGLGGRKRTLNNYYESLSVRRKSKTPGEEGIVLLDDVTAGRTQEQRVPTLTEFRIQFIDCLLEQVQVWFPEDTYIDFDIFDQQNWPKTEGFAASYGQASIQRSTSRLTTFDPTTVALQWRNILGAARRP